MVKGTIKEVGCFYGDRGNTEGYAVFSRWETELKNLFDDLDDHVDEFVIQMDQQQGSDRWHGRKDDIKEQSHGGKKFRQKLIRLPVKQRRKRMKVTENNLMETKKVRHRLSLLLYTTAHPDSEFSIPRKARRILTPDMTKVAESLSNIQPRSLFLFGKQELSDENWLNFEGAKFLRVLDLEDAKIRRLPDEVGDLIHLAYLGLKNNELNEFPDRLGNLRALQSLDIRWCGDLTELSTAILKLVRLRHLKMFKSRNVSGMKLSGGIGTLGSLLTLTGVHAGGKIAGELRKLTQLRRLGVMDVAEENADELYASIMVMQGLLSLSLEAKHTFDEGHLVLRDSFSPPSILRKLRLEGLLENTKLAWFNGKSYKAEARFASDHSGGTGLLPLLDEQEQRLKPDGGVENYYKIRNIPKVTFIPASVVASRFNERFSSPPTPATDKE
ncbi:hypothetical protein D5086_023439 [Populus alba]|uniref:Uncharacterized protein n=1 Tax=Populus alba TaxID=43335 RepID=A0ACC4B9S0_POPAL